MLLANTGFWTPLGQAASVDWCEANYLIVTWIAEFWNTLSSLPIMLGGLIGWFLLRRLGREVETRYTLAFALIGLVGLGSVGFHGTLLASAQALDELPMVYAALVLAYCLRFGRIAEDGPSQVRWRVGLTIFALGFTVAYFLSDTYFQLFVGCFGLIVAWLCIQGARVVFSSPSGSSLRPLYWMAAGGFVGAFVCFWLPERFLGCTHPAQALQLHALFHLLAAVGSYNAGLVLLFDRLRFLGLEPKMSWGWPIPFPRLPGGDAGSL